MAGFKMGNSSNTIGSENCYAFEQRGNRKAPADWSKYPRVTQSPQQYGYNVTPQNMVKPAAPGEYRAGRRFPELNVGRPNPRGSK